MKSLFTGLENYGNIFQRKDLPVGLRGKKYDLFGNIEQIAEFHRDEFLPMLHRNRRDLKRLFDEFMAFLDVNIIYLSPFAFTNIYDMIFQENCFYGYVIFTMNKQKSLKLCDTYKNYFTVCTLEEDMIFQRTNKYAYSLYRASAWNAMISSASTVFLYNPYNAWHVIPCC